MCRFLLTLPCLLLVAPAGAFPQAVRVAATEESFRQTPDGRLLGTVFRDARLTAGSLEGAWREVTLEGWIWSPSIAGTNRGGFDATVSSPDGENLRAEPAPNADRVARLLQGFLLEVVESRGNWTRVRRTGWMWEPSLERVPGEPTGAGPSPTGAAEVSLPRGGDRVLLGEDAVALLAAPGGDTLAVVRPRTDLGVAERNQRWVRVFLEGWVPVRELVDVPSDSLVLGVSAAALRADPERYRGARVRWRVQFIALERAEPERTDFYEGEPFLLARAPEPSEGFVYLAVPPELLEEAESLRPLAQVEVLARVRTGRSALMGAPVLDLLAIL